MLNIKLKQSAIFKVGYLGLCCEERGTLKLLEAIRQLRNENYKMEIKFVGPVTGDVSDTSLYRRSISERWAEFTGRLDPNEAWMEISECKVGAAVLLPSQILLNHIPQSYLNIWHWVFQPLFLIFLFTEKF
ncbi:MAG: hypothetical protein MZV64_15625 [Ignavibacteriales bacterium]|nr:hypothetical protein [Ignavibacteriales bacterium]